MLRRRPARTNQFRVVASTGVLVAALALLEGAATVLAPELPVWRAPDNSAVVMTGSETRLWGMTEGVRKNGTVTCSIGPLGLRGAAPVVPRPPGRQRIIVVGDSSFFGHGIPDDQTLAVQLQADLQRRGIDADVVNGAIPGYSTEQTKILLDEVGWGTEPTLLISGNLWSDNNADGFRDADLLKSTALRHNPLAVSAFFRLSVAWIDRARGGTGPRLVTWTKDSVWPEAKERRVPLQDYANNLDFMVHAAREHGAGMAFISPANQGLVNGEFPHGAGWDPYFAAQKAVAAFHHVPVISAVDAMVADPAAVGDKFVDQMHPSSLGAGAIARAVADSLIAAGWPQNPLSGSDEHFDASGLVDDAEVRPGGQSAKYSPQAQLFPDVVDGSAANSEDPDHTEPGENPGGAVTTVPGPTPPNQGTRTTDHGWDVTGSVSGGTGPIKVEVSAPDGRPLGFTNILVPGAFKMHVRGAEEEVRVTVTDAAGRTETVVSVRGGAVLTVGFP